MTGRLLDFSVNENQGVISGDDGNRYSFSGTEWKAKELPVSGMYLDFVPAESRATAIYRAAGRSTMKSQSVATSVDGTTVSGPYRSSDDKVLAGVCSGLAHRSNVHPLVVRLAFVLLPIWPIWIIVYAIGAFNWPEMPTLRQP